MTEAQSITEVNYDQICDPEYVLKYINNPDFLEKAELLVNNGQLEKKYRDQITSCQKYLNPLNESNFQIFAFYSYLSAIIYENDETLVNKAKLYYQGLMNQEKSQLKLIREKSQQRLSILLLTNAP